MAQNDQENVSGLRIGNMTIPLAIVSAIVVQALTMMKWSSGIDNRLENLENQFKDAKEVIQVLGKLPGAIDAIERELVSTRLEIKSNTERITGNERAALELERKLIRMEAIQGIFSPDMPKPPPDPRGPRK